MRPHRRIRPAPFAAGVLLAMLLLWFGGLLRFAAELPRQVDEPDRPTDAIIVLTGGTSRLDVGLMLLDQQKAGRMLISGVNPGTTMAMIEEVAGHADLLACCVDLGFAAADTVGNAIEAAAWARAGNYRSLRVVTASYHMPRSVIELQRRVPGIELVQHPVFPDRFKLESWWQWPGTAHLLATEFSKYLFALIRARLEGALGMHLGE